MQTFKYAPGTRVEVRRGSFPIDRKLVGRRGLVVEVDEYRQGRYGVQLDDEERVRDFAEGELLPLTDEPKPEPDRGSAGPGIE